MINHRMQHFFYMLSSYRFVFGFRLRFGSWSSCLGDSNLLCNTVVRVAHSYTTKIIKYEIFKRFFVPLSPDL